MKALFRIALVSTALTLAGCGGQGDDALGDNVADAAEAKADQLDAAADNATTGAQEEQLEDAAEITRETGEAQEEAIDDADVVVNQ